jgi:hypothetical protein
VIDSIITGAMKMFSAGLKVPRQCPLAFLVEMRLRVGEALGSEKGQEL